MTAGNSRTARAVDAALARGGAALVGYLPIGYPDLDASVDAAIALLRHGADVVELGVPYSDPVMDGPVIQHATTRAIEHGFHLPQVFEAVRRVAAAARDDQAVLVMTYFNPVLHYGVDRFAADLARAGGAGLITPDLVPEEAGEWLTAASAHGLDRVFLVAPSSTEERLRTTVAACRGFVYAASTMGVTGARSTVDDHARPLVARTRAAGAPRVCVGLGVSNGAQAREIGRFADGVIVGSALVRALTAGGPAAVAELTEDLAAGVAGSRSQVAPA